MRKKWNPEIIEHLKSEGLEEICEVILEEMAGLIYSEICQFQKNSLYRPFDEEENFLQRAGTDA